MRPTAIEGKNQLTLGQLIELIERQPLKYTTYDEKSEEPKSINFDFGNMRPSGLTSWRGAYEELAICYKEGDSVTAESFLKELKEANGKTFHGWKGGEYEMDLDTPLWIANSGHSSDSAPIGIRVGEYSITILTSFCEY
jgi:hypothetical protein